MLSEILSVFADLFSDFLFSVLGWVLYVTGAILIFVLSLGWARCDDYEGKGYSMRRPDYRFLGMRTEGGVLGLAPGYGILGGVITWGTVLFYACRSLG